MLDILNILPAYLVLITLALVVLPTIVAILLRRSLYNYLTDSANKVLRLSFGEIRGKQPAIVKELETRFKRSSKQLEQVNTIALIDGLYSQERLKFFGIYLRCEQWDYVCKTLPNLLLAFGLFGTLVGISSNLYNLSQTINLEQNGADINNLIAQLQQPLQNMGIAFSTSLFAIFCSSILVVTNLRYNTNFAKSLLISSLEDYLDNVFKIKVKGYSRLDRAIERMAHQQNDFLNRFHEKVAEVLEQTMGNAANKIVSANQDFHNNVDVMVSRFNDISSSMAASTDSFQASAFSFKKQTETVTEIVPQFETAAKNLKSSSNLYLLSAKKIEESKFSDNLEKLTANLATTQKSFSESTAYLGKSVKQISQHHQKLTELANKVYTELHTASHKLQDSASGFIKASSIFQKSEFADKLSVATEKLTTIPQQFDNSTQVLHQSTNNLSEAINNINTHAVKTDRLIEQVNSLNQYSSELLEQSDLHIQQEIVSFDRISSGMETTVITLENQREQIDRELEKFVDKLLYSFEQQTDKHRDSLDKSTQQIEEYLDNLTDLQSQFSAVIDKVLNHEKNIISELNSLNLESHSNSTLEIDERTKQNLQNISFIYQELVKISSFVDNQDMPKCNFKLCQ